METPSEIDITYMLTQGVKDNTFPIQERRLLHRGVALLLQRTLIDFGGMMVTTQQIQKWITDGELWRFYKTKEWISLKNSVLAAGHYECKICRQRGRITRYDIDEQGRKHLLSTVHHVNHVRSHPELAMSRTYRDPTTNEVKDNLIPVCKACHNKLHPEKRKNNSKKNCYTNVERW